MLEGALAASDDALAFEAGRALAHTSGEAASEALRRGAASHVDGVARNALRGIAERGDASLCDAVGPCLERPDPVGAAAREATAKLGCAPGGE